MPNKFSYKKIILGITGGIAVYKAVELVRLLRESQLEVKVVMTQSATEFVSPLTFSTLSNNQVFTQIFNHDSHNVKHIELSKWADAIVIAPATANIIAKLAHGLCDDLLSTICLACNKPMYIAPAMNKVMWENPITQSNITLLKNVGMNFIGPDVGFQACGDSGTGRLSDPQIILDKILNLKEKLLINTNIIITAGPTVEPIDPVRFISNRSSGKMGYAIANAAIAHGAKVTLISGPTKLEKPAGCSNYFCVNTALEMLEMVKEHITNCDIFISTAAVSDYRVENYSNQKIKKSLEGAVINLVKNPDILLEVSRLSKRPYMVGFAAETEDIENNAKSKLDKKNLDIIAANFVGENGAFENEKNQLIIFCKDGEKFDTGLKNKNEIAHKLIQIIYQKLFAGMKSDRLNH